MLKCKVSYFVQFKSVTYSYVICMYHVVYVKCFFSSYPYKTLKSGDEVVKKRSRSPCSPWRRKSTSKEVRRSRRQESVDVLEEVVVRNVVLEEVCDGEDDWIWSFVKGVGRVRGRWSSERLGLEINTSYGVLNLVLFLVSS